MKRLRTEEGFTLIELVIIILVLGILAATAIPKFYDLTAKAKIAAEKGVVGGVRGGIAVVYASNLVNGITTFPASLGGTAPGTASATNLFFGNVLSPGVDADWTINGSSVYIGPAGGSYTYSATSGTFQ
jgi:type II secretory pathway pseudopilin PulG